MTNVKYTKLSLAIAITIGLGLTGCGPKIISAPTLETNKDVDYKSNKLANDNSNTHMYIYLDSAVIKPVVINIDNLIFDQLAKNTYGYYKIAKGTHWIGVLGAENSSFMCINSTTNNNLLYEVDTYMGIMDARVEFKPGTVEDMKDDDLKQIKQKNQNIASSLYTRSAESFSVEINGDDEYLLEIKHNIDEKINKLSIDKGKGLVIKLSTLSKEDGNQFGRYFWGLTPEAEKYKASIKIKSEFLINGQKVDEMISVKELTGGIFGGGKSNMYSLVSEEVVSYAICKYFNEKFPAIRESK